MVARKLKKFKQFIVSISVFSFLLATISFVSTSNAAFGISPPWVRNNHMLPNTTFEQIIKLSRSEAEKSMKVTAEITGDKQLAKWINISDEDNLIMRKGDKITPITVLVDIPKRAAIKKYHGNIALSLDPIVDDTSLAGGQVAIALGANIAIEIDVVGEKMTDFWIKSTSVEPLEEGRAFGLGVKIQNLGNTEIEGVEGKIEIYDISETELLHSLEFPPFRFPIDPDAIDSPKMFFKEAKLKAGEYRVIVKIFKNGEVVHEDRLYQKVEEKEVSEAPVAPLEDIEEEPILSNNIQTPIIIEVPISEMRQAAPASKKNNIPFILGLAGLGFGFSAIIGLIIVLISILSKQSEKKI